MSSEPGATRKGSRSRFSVACNFDPELIEELGSLPVYEVYGKLTADFFGGGRPSFYLPQVRKADVERTVRRCHQQGIEFNYLLNSSSMNNLEFTSRGQREFHRLVDWLSDIGVDSVTVANLFFLRVLKKRYPHLKVRVSAHRETDNARQARFWEDNGADCIVISETTVHREFEVLRAIRESVQCDLSLIVNNWCRQDCAIASNHAVQLSNASRSGGRNFPLDYCSVYCNAFRLEEPVNYVRANWIRPEDLHIYEEMGYRNFKIVERNTPTALLVQRVRAYAAGHYEGNLLDLVQNYAYPRSAFKRRDRQYFSVGRMVSHFAKPREVNLLRFFDVVRYGKLLSLLYPRDGDNPVWVDNRALDGFIDHFAHQGCESLDCEACRYCHRWAERAVKIDPLWRQKMLAESDHLLESLHGGELWESHARTIGRKLRDSARQLWRGGAAPETAREASPGRHQAIAWPERRTRSGRHLPVVQWPDSAEASRRQRKARLTAV